MNDQKLLERLENPNAVLAGFDAADREQDRAAVEAVFAAQLSVERHRGAGETSHIDAVADPARPAAEIRSDPIAPQFADHQQFVRRHDRAPLPGAEARILKTVDMMDGTGKAPDQPV